MLASVLISACAAPKAALVKSVPAGRVRPFDLLPRGFDDNGLGLNSELGWHYNRRCHLGGAEDREGDPARCSWRFIDDGTQPATSRPPCNTHMMDPDFSTFVLSKLNITCSDSPLNFRGHVDWGARYGGAATYEGWLTWEGFSGALPSGDFDLNFVLTLNDEHALAIAMGNDWDWIGIEFDSREVTGFGTRWWTDLREKIDRAPLEAADYVGRKYAIVTGLLGIDAEHMSARNPGVELHPAYAIALHVKTSQEGSTRTERWAMFARDRGNEGLCSDWEKVHVMPLLGGAHVVRLPWKKGMNKIEIVEPTEFCTSGAGAPQVTVAYDDDHQGVLVKFDLPPGGIVDGDLYLKWSEPAAPEEATPEPPKAMKRRAPTRELENPDVREQRLAYLRANSEEWAAFEAATGKPTCTKIIPRLQKEAVPPRREGKSDCKSPSDPISEERAKVLRGGAAARATVARPTGPTAVTPSAVQRDTRTPREKYCAERAKKSEVAAKFCAQGDAD